MSDASILYSKINLLSLSLSDGPQCKGLLETFLHISFFSMQAGCTGEIDPLWLGGRDRGGAVLFNSP